MSQTKSVAEVYKSVVSDVIDGVREAFQEEGLDEQFLQEFKQLWESKLKSSKALDGSIADLSNTPTINSNSRIPPPAHSHHQSRSFQQSQHLILNNSSNNNIGTLAASQLQQLTNLQGSVLNLGSNQLTQLSAGQNSSHSLNPVLLQHLNNLSNLVPRGNTRPILIQPQIGGASFIQSQNNNIIFGLSDQPIATNASPQNGVTLDNNNSTNIVQLDGLDDSSSDDDDDDNKHDDDNEEVVENNAPVGEEVDDDPLNSGDDDSSDENAQDLFDADNVVVCQFDKINRCKAKWKFHLKDGIMNLSGKDYVFQKATGDAEF